MNFLVIVSVIMIITLMYVLLSGRTNPAIPFVIIPIVAALIAGFSLSEVGSFAAIGIGSVAKVVVLFIFSITYFGIMNDVGLFDKVVKKLKRFGGKSVVKITIATALIAFITHLDGAGSSTFLITIPAMLPVYKKFNMNTKTLLLIVGIGAGVMNLFPWGGPFIRAGVLLGIDPNIMWHDLIPTQIFGMSLVLGMAYILGRREMKNGACITDLAITDETEEHEGDLNLKKPKLYYFNWVLTAILLFSLVQGLLPSHILFLIATVIALLINYPNSADQTDRIKAHAPDAMYMVITIIAAGIFLGIFRESKMVNIMPEFLGPYLHIVLGLFAAPLGMVFGPDPYVYGLTELIVGVTSVHGVEATSVVKAMVLGECSGWSISPVVSTVYLGLGLAGVELKDHIRNAFPWVWGITVLMLVFALVTGGI